tara:strand:+ start:514 stop:654 length:141 start_codon:yes stop_codon:yes gene_type:complete
MKEENKKKLKDYEINLVTWNRGKYGKYKILKKINKKAFAKQLKMSD